MKRDYSAFCDRGAGWTEEYVALPTGVELRSVIFTPGVASSAPPVIFIPGMGSIIENFRDTVIELTRSHTVLYIETREKASARITRRHRFSVEDITEDIIHFARRKFPEGGRYVMAGYSLGATAIAEAFSRLENKPEKIILIEPNSSFPFHGWLLLLSRAAGVIYRPVKPLLKWYLRRFRINLDEDPEMYHINCRILDSAEPVRLGAAVRHLTPYRMDGCLQLISVPTLVVVASSDRFHSHDGGTDIAQRIANADYLDMIDNKRTHSAEMGRVIGEFISSPVQIQVPAGQP